MRVLLAGCSWACGEWGWNDHNQYRLRHFGLQYYLRRAGHSVQVVAESSSSNSAQLNRIHRALARASFDRVIFIQTDPLRDADSIPTTLAEHTQLEEHLLHTLYQGLAQIDCLVLLVGGNSPVCTDLVPTGSVRVVETDWVQAMLGYRPYAPIARMWHYTDCAPDLLAWWEQTESARAHFIAQCKQTGTPENEWFWPDGYHPNRKGHRWLADRLLPVLSNSAPRA